MLMYSNWKLYSDRKLKEAKFKLKEVEIEFL